MLYLSIRECKEALKHYILMLVALEGKYGDEFLIENIFKSFSSFFYEFLNFNLWLKEI